MAKKKSAITAGKQPLVQVIAAVVVAYGLISLAIDNGSLLVYGLAIASLIFAGTRLPKLFNKQ